MGKLVLRLVISLALTAGVTGTVWATPTGISFRSVTSFGPPVHTANGQFAADIAVLGDLNGDGIDDLAVVNEVNRVFILFMRLDGSISSYQYHSLGSNGLPASPNGGFTAAVESLGDLDGDGVVDIAVGDPRGGNWPQQYGNVWVLFLNANGSIKAHQRITRYVGGFTGALVDLLKFDQSIAYLGDIDGDGNKEIAVGSPQGDYWWDVGTGNVWILDLSPAGLVTAHAQVPGVPGFTVPFANRDLLGSAVETIPDLDGNGTPELAIGAAYDAIGAGPRAGSVWILFMNSDYSVSHFTTIGPGAGGLTHAPQSDDLFGSALAWLPNVGCGRQALAVGAPRQADAVWFLMVNDDGTVDDDYVMLSDDPSFPYKVLNPADQFGEGLASLGDRDGDGITDIAIGQSWYTGSVYMVTLETCRVEPRRIDMGSVLIGEDTTMTVTITNNGCTTREGPLSVSGSNYSLVGSESLSLEPGASDVVTVRFAPTDVENPTGVLSTPFGDVSFTGIGHFPACSSRWNIGTFNAANLDTIAGNHAMWCGVPGGTPNFKFAPGYGNGWNESLYFSAPAPYSHVPTEVELTFAYNSDMIDGDTFYVLTYHTGSLAIMFELTGTTTGGTAVAQFTVHPSDYIDLGGGQKGIAVILNVLTNYIYSDEDFIDTDGAIQIDNVVLKFNDVVVSAADFEPGGSDGGWCNGMLYPAPPDPSQNWSSAFGPPPVGKGLNGVGHALELYQNLLVVGGEFTQAGSVAAKRIAGWDGSNWQAFDSGFDNGAVVALTVFEGDLFAGGSFTSAGGVPLARLARWNGSTWTAIPAAPLVSTLAVHDGLLYIGHSMLWMWDGAAWSSASMPITGFIHDLGVYQDDLYVVGDGAQGFMYRWDGTGFRDGKSFNNSVDVLHVHDDALYVGGHWNNPPAPGAGWGVSAWNGSSWVTPREDYPLGSEGMATLNGRLVIGGGALTSYDGAVEVVMPGVNGFDHNVRELAVYQGDLYAVGNLTQAGGRPSNYIAKWSENVVGVREPVPTSALRVETFPNPFNPSMTIRIVYSSREPLFVDVFDVGGRRVKRLAKDSRAPGTVEMRWDGTNDRGEPISSGVYFLRVQSGRDVVTKKLVHVK